MQAAINRAEGGLGTLVYRIGDDVALKDLDRMLVFEAEIGKGVLLLQRTARR